MKRVAKCAIGRLWFLFAVCLLVASLGHASAQTSSDIAGRVNDALQRHDFHGALQLLQPVLRSSPGNAQLWAMQGSAYAGEGRKAEALASFHHALQINPNFVPALRGQAQIQYEAGNAAAIPVLKQLLQVQPADQTAHAMLAVLDYQQGNCGDAVIHFEKAGKLLEERVEALHAEAVCLVRLKKFEHAAAVFERALALQPDDGRERQLLAAIQLMAKQPQVAIGTLEPLLKGEHPDVSALELASAAYEGAHDTDHAVEVLRQAILLQPDNVNLYLDFANLSSVHQSFQVGINVVNDGLNQQPKAAPLYFARGILYVQLGQYDKAQADFENAYSLDPNQSLSIAAQGLAAVQQNNLDQALAGVQEKLAHKPDDPILLYMQADVLARKGTEPGSPEFQTAMRSAKKAVALRPALGPARGVLAKLYLQSGDYAQATLQCKKALEINPQDQTALYHLIQAQRKSGNTKELPALLQRLAQLRQEASREEREQYRYKLVEGDVAAK